MNINDTMLYNYHDNTLLNCTILKGYINNRYRIRFTNSFNRIDETIVKEDDLYFSKDDYITKKIAKLTKQITVLQAEIKSLEESRKIL